MLTLSYGFKKPETNDKGSVVFPALEGDIQQLNDHNHDGANSALIPPSSLTVVTQDVLSGGWIDQGGGTWQQQVTLLPGFNFDNISLTIRTAAGHYAYPTLEKVSNTQILLKVNDPTLNLNLVYGV